ncbi:MAG: response regulator, partial [Candidatus Tectomicrobia bacterium]
VRLPIAEVPKASSTPQVDLSEARMLVVDDVAVNRTILREHLRVWGVALAEAASGEEALHILRTAVAEHRPYPVVITDYMMPQMDGLQLAAAMREDARLNDTLILMASSAAHIDRSALEHVGIAALLLKPLRSSQLHETLCTLWSAWQRGETVNLLTPARGGPHEPAATVSFDARVLLVEDVPANQMVATVALERYGCDVVVAQNGQEALDRLAHECFDLVLMDCHMPVMDGFEATRRIRAVDGPAATVTIVAMTAAAFKGDADKCLEAGMDDYVAKPTSQQKLLELLRTHCGGLERSTTSSVTDAEASTAAADSAGTQPMVHETTGATSAAWSAGALAAGMPAASEGEVDVQVLDHTVLWQLEQDVGPDAFGTIVGLHISEITEKIGAIPPELEAQRLDVVERYAHNIKTCAASVGAQALAQHAQALEAACRERHGGEATALLRDLAELADTALRAVDALQRRRVRPA